MSRQIQLLKPSIILLVFMIALPQLSETIYSPALPNIASDLKAAMHLVEWTLSIYFLGFAVGVAIWGKVSDHLGRRPVAVIGLVIYIVTSIACATLTKNVYSLLFLRFVQAFGISVGSVITQTIMRDCFDGIERNKVFSLAGGVIGLAPAVGPVLGGLLVEHFSWQSNFYMLSLFGTALFTYILLSLPETLPNKHTQSQKKIRYRTIFVKMLSDQHVIASAILVGAYNGILFSYYAHAPFIFIDNLKMQPSNFGYLGLAMALAVSFGSFLSHRLNKYYDVKQLIAFSCTLNLFAMSLFVILLASIAEINTYFSTISVMVPMMIFYVSFGIGIPNILSQALNKYQTCVGTAGSILGLFYYIVVSCIVFALGLFSNKSPIWVMAIYFLIISMIMFFSRYALNISKQDKR